MAYKFHAHRLLRPGAMLIFRSILNAHLWLNALLSFFFSLVIFVSTSRAQVPPVRGLYINFVNAWIGDSIEESKILNYCSVYGFNYITIYDLNLLSWSVAQKIHLLLFQGKESIWCYAGWSCRWDIQFFNNLIVPYNTGRTNRRWKFDVFNYEFEFCSLPVLHLIMDQII